LLAPDVLVKFPLQSIYVILVGFPVTSKHLQSHGSGARPVTVISSTALSHLPEFNNTYHVPAIGPSISDIKTNSPRYADKSDVVLKKLPSQLYKV